VLGPQVPNTVDVIAIQRFFLVFQTGIANVGKYQVTLVNRTYPGIVSDQRPLRIRTRWFSAKLLLLLQNVRIARLSSVPGALR
jgi:hypothetical protein